MMIEERNLWPSGSILTLEAKMKMWNSQIVSVMFIVRLLATKFQLRSYEQLSFLSLYSLLCLNATFLSNLHTLWIRGIIKETISKNGKIHEIHHNSFVYFSQCIIHQLKYTFYKDIPTSGKLWFIYLQSWCRLPRPTFYSMSFQCLGNKTK